MSAETLTVRVQGDFALFTRPEFSAERVSYQVMTPSAARGILEAIFWKPEIRWRVQQGQFKERYAQQKLIHSSHFYYD
jgi:CRISPR-associated protein Cas5d